ncbi:HAMP domain-containing histidine kinase [Clostridium estertheticum]|uniref:HAMP domain-containing sensor histidine kinase n=1 Tax=Clostridium estertheticum TaxID=238834 RepID=UPI0013EEE939|nr:ATP-binding protein [Clostridium estertheticum]MBZ9606677.1 HAMP domain-containing histidine kinase [Clostridium estertheticum]
MRGIKARLVWSYLLVIFFTVITLEVFLTVSIEKYYYKNMESLLSSQIKGSVDFYNNYFSSSSLKENVENNADIFWKNTSAEVQIIDSSGMMLMDSIGNFNEKPIEDDDVKKALMGGLGTFTKKDKYTKENFMYVSCPLKSSNKIEGVLRFVTSLSEVDALIRKITFLFLGVGALVIVISGVSSIFISNTIVEPLEEIKNLAKKFASGNFNERLEKIRNDEIGELSDTFNFMAEEIEKNQKLKNEFIASVSHELRTPLTSIKGWAATISSGSLEDKEEILDGLSIIEKESDKLTGMVEELLDFSKFISGKVPLTKEYVNIQSIIAYIEKQFMPKSIRHNINFTVKIQEALSPVFADEKRVNQVIINVLDNAFNFTKKGGNVTLEACIAGNNICIIIKDDGIGISPADLPKVTEKFFKGRTSMSQNGIGLSLCKEIVEMHNGKLEISSEHGMGTDVRIFLPLA